jgi:hypothetical protein
MCFDFEHRPFELLDLIPNPNLGLEDAFAVCWLGTEAVPVLSWDWTAAGDRRWTIDRPTMQRFCQAIGFFQEKNCKELSESEEAAETACSSLIVAPGQGIAEGDLRMTSI